MSFRRALIARPLAKISSLVQYSGLQRPFPESSAASFVGCRSQHRPDAQRERWTVCRELLSRLPVI